MMHGMVLLATRAVEVGEGHVPVVVWAQATCLCGWISEASYAPEIARAEWDNHRREALQLEEADDE